ncbi:MAG TPA: PHB depolymerase family esterase [Gemmatales bacterium]|nr:PHB depolymerase family esterase [Gemmatales bacterium]
MESGLHTFTLEHQGRIRSYRLYTPTTGQPPYPVVLAFHGAGGTARIMLFHSRWLQQAEHGGFIVVAPEGTSPQPDEKPSFRFNPQLWNLGGATTAAPTGNADDVGFVRAILDKVATDLPIDTSRIYSTGFSNGAGLTFRLAVELGDRLAAIAPVAGLPYFKSGPPPRPIPTYFLIGSEDPLVPWQGGKIISPWTNQPTVRPAVLEQLHLWTTTSRFHLIGGKSEHGEQIEHATIGTLPDDPACVMYTRCFGLGHHWPGGRDVGVPEEVLGPRIKTIDATERIWQFLSQYQHPAALLVP